MTRQKPSIEKMNYEEALAELEETVAALEAGDTPLEEAITLFERGQALAQRCAALLDEADLRVRQLSAAAPDQSSGENNRS